jgi:hypothetical protein
MYGVPEKTFAVHADNHYVLNYTSHKIVHIKLKVQ